MTLAAQPIAALSDKDQTTPEHGAEIGLKADEYARAVEILGRTPNKVELGCFSAMWSEHCSYKSSRLHLARLPNDGPRVVVGPGENAGIIEVEGKVCVAFKVESHNHPSFIEPYQGAATGAGGILRDVFTMGARPIAAANLFRFGQQAHKKTPHLLRGCVKGVGDYGNCFGVPTVYTDARFDPCYDGNILVNAFALGVVDKDKIFLGRAEGVGNPVFYVGAKTGRDGIHGATMASDSFSEHEEADRPTVQVGDPFKEKLLLEACMEAFQTSALVGIQDMGAAGLTSSSFEMASRTGAGLKLDLDKIPTRETGMTAYELLLSESQERMLLVAEKGREQEVIDIFNKWDLDATCVGEVTDDGMVRIVFGGEEIGVLPAAPLADEAPKYDRPQAGAPEARRDGRLDEIAGQDPGALFDRLVGDPSLASRRWIYEQYDREVLVGTLDDGMHAASAVVQVPGTQAAVALSLVSAEHVGALDPREGGARSVAEGALRAACVGAQPAAVSDCLNYGNPEVPEIMREISEGIDGIAEACRALEVPVISGNVSLYNETDGRSIHPTPGIALVGLVADMQVRASLKVPAGAALVRVGRPTSSLEGAEALRAIGPAPRGAGVGRWSLDDVRGLCDGVRKGIEAGLIQAARPVLTGGAAIALTELMLASESGLMVELKGEPLVALFAEDQPAVIAAVAHDRVDALTELFTLPVEVIGGARGDALDITAGEARLTRDRQALQDAWEGALPHVADASAGNA